MLDSCVLFHFCKFFLCYEYKLNMLPSSPSSSTTAVSSDASSSLQDGNRDVSCSPSSSSNFTFMDICRYSENKKVLIKFLIFSSILLIFPFLLLFSCNYILIVFFDVSSSRASVVSCVVAIILVNVVMGSYAYSAYVEEKNDYDHEKKEKAKMKQNTRVEKETTFNGEMQNLNLEDENEKCNLGQRNVGGKEKGRTNEENVEIFSDRDTEENRQSGADVSSSRKTLKRRKPSKDEKKNKDVLNKGNNASLPEKEETESSDHSWQYLDSET